MEDELISLFLSANDNEMGFKAYVNVARSFNDIASETILGDTSMVVIGFSIVFTYVVFMLGHFSWIGTRVTTSYLELASDRSFDTKVRSRIQELKLFFQSTGNVNFCFPKEDILCSLSSKTFKLVT